MWSLKLHLGRSLVGHEGKREKKENPVEINVYEEWDRKARTQTKKATLAFLL